jgi:hypothetical protein
MANSKLLKDAIADAKAVRETAIANAKIALEEAFTPRLQSILSKKLTAEMEGEEEEVDVNEEYGADDVDANDSTEIGAGEGQTGSGTDGDAPQGIATDAHTELGDTEKETAEPGKEDENMPLAEGEEDENQDGVIDDPTGAVTEEEDEDELDLESIIRELEDELGAESDEVSEEDEVEAPAADTEVSEEDEAPAVDAVEAPEAEVSEEDEIDLEEILREMGYGDDEEEKVEESEEESNVAAEMEAELEEAYKVIKSLKSTINEVNLLNAKLLYTNKLFRSYDLTNEQKHKVVETLDRTQNVREVKLVFATLAESMKIGGTAKKVKTNKITESFASKKVASTAPKAAIINESNDMAERFKKLANIK